MKQITLSDLMNKASELKNNNVSWHFHILTPTCMLNNTNDYALVLEDSTNNNTYVCYSKEPYMTEGKQLVKLLHGNNIVKEEETSELKEPSEECKPIIERANELATKNVNWHHHMLFPNCIFNKNKGKWTLMLEDKEEDKVLEALSENEPKDDLKHVETAFYSQDKAA